MFQKSIISEELSLYNFFEKLKLDLYLTKPQISRLENIMNATLSKRYKRCQKLQRYNFTVTNHNCFTI